MKTQAPQQIEPNSSASWWDRATDTEVSAARGKRLMTISIIVALGLAVVFGAKSFMATQTANEHAAISGLILEGELLLPTPASRVAYGKVADASTFFAMETAELQSSGLRKNALGDALTGRGGPEDASAYEAKLSSLLADFADNEDAAMASDQAWLFMNTRQMLCWYAAINSSTTNDRISFLTQQLAHLSMMQDTWPDHPVLSIIADPSGQPGKTLMAIWTDRATKEKAFWEKTSIPAITADENLSAVMTLDNNKVLKMEFFSRVAPRTVANFVRLARSGYYDGTAFHAISETNCDGGDPLSRLCPDRPRIWSKGGPGYSIPREASQLLKVEAGSVSMSLGVAGLHGSHFSIQTAEDTGRNFGSTTVFARITEGIEAIQEYIKTDTIDDEQSENPALPLVPLRIKSLVITGEPEHGTGDSWQPLVVEQEIPDTTEEEKRLVKEAKDAKAKEESDKPDGGEESAPKKSDEPKK